MLQRLIALLASASPSAGRIAGQNPVLVWVVVGFVAIFAVEFLAKEGIAIWRELAIARLDVEKKNLENEMQIKTLVSTANRTLAENEVVTAEKKGAMGIIDPVPTPSLTLPPRLPGESNLEWTRKVLEMATPGERVTGERVKKNCDYKFGAAGCQGDSQATASEGGVTPEQKSAVGTLMGGVCGALVIAYLALGSRFAIPRVESVARKTNPAALAATLAGGMAALVGAPFVLASPLAEAIRPQFTLDDIPWWVGLLCSLLWSGAFLYTIGAVGLAIWELLRREKSRT